MNFYSWFFGEKVVEDAAKRQPKGESLADHRKHCRAKKGECPFEKQVDEVDDVSPSVGNTQDISQQSLASMYERGGVSKELISSARQLHKKILDGTVKPKRLPASVFQSSETSRIPTWMTYAYLVASNYGNDDKQATKVLEDFAKAAGMYSDDLIADFSKKHGKPIGHGMESDVFREDGGHVVKSSTLGMDTKDTLSKIERILLGNIYFPETGYEPFGMGRSPDGGLLFALRQNYIPFKRKTKLDDNAINDWLKKKGWDVADPEKKSFVSHGWDLAALDMHNDNVVMTDGGDVVCVDPCIVPNTERVGLFGYYDYDNPPTSIS